MAEFPALPLFTDAYMADTRHLNAAQHGAFLLLLMTAWRMPDCCLPDDDEKLSRWAAMDIRTWRNNKAVVMEFWQLSATQKWSQGRLLDERKRVEDKRDKNVAAGKASALKRHNTRSTPVQPNGNQNPTIPNPIPIKDKRHSAREDFETFWKAFPKKRAGSREKAWGAWQQAINRAGADEILKGVGNYAASREVAQGFAKGAAAWLNDDRWTSDYSTINQGKPNANSSPKPTKSERFDAAADAGIAEILASVESAAPS